MEQASRGTESKIENGFHEPIYALCQAYALRQAFTPQKASQMFGLEPKMTLGCAKMFMKLTPERISNHYMFLSHEIVI